MNDNLQRIVDILHELDKRAAFALENKDYDEAIVVYESILNAQESLNLEKFSGHTMYNIANVLTIKGEYKSALDYIEKALYLKSIQKDYKDRGNLQILRSNILFITNRSDEAEKILTQEIRKNKNYSICGQMELLLFSHYMRTNKKSKARLAIDNAINHFRLDNNTNELKKALSYRASYFKSLGQEQYAKIDELEIRNI